MGDYPVPLLCLFAHSFSERPANGGATLVRATQRSFSTIGVVSRRETLQVNLSWMECPSVVMVPSKNLCIDCVSFVSGDVQVMKRTPSRNSFCFRLENV